jgi:uncharacterized membrane protein YadS
MNLGLFLSKKTSSDDPNQKIGKAKKPWFILGFLAAAAIVTWALWAKGSD